MSSTRAKISPALLAVLMVAITALVALAPCGFAVADGGSLAGSSGKALTMQAKTAASKTVTMNRMYNPNSGEHFYTASTAERDNLVRIGWNYEGTAWIAPASSSTPVYRLYNPNNGDHHYSMSAQERDALVRLGWHYEGIGWYSADSNVTRVGLYRQFNPNAQVGSHNYTVSADENVQLVALGWNPEGVAWFGLASESGHTGWLNVGGAWRYYTRGAVHKGWLVTDKPPAIAAIGGGLQRYWLDANGSLAVARIIDPANSADKAAGYRAYATGGGYVMRNSVVQLGGAWYVTDDGGKLSSDAIASRLIAMAQGYSSPSRYLIMVDVDNPRTVVLEGSRGNWKAKYVWDCCTGAPESPTVTGVFHVGIKGYSFGEEKGYSCYYYTQFYGNYLFHTREYYPYSRTLKDGRMGVMISAGCVRLYDENAIWIQKNIPSGTTVVCTH